MTTLASLFLAATLLQTPGVRFEAESAKVGDTAEVHRDETASGGSFVHFGKAGSLAWTLEVPRSGRYELMLRYRTGESDRAQKLSVNGKAFGIGFARTAGEWVETRVVRNLQAGKNEVVLASDWGEMDVDLLALPSLPRGVPTPAVEYPKAVPATNVYQRGSSGTGFLLEFGGRTLSGILRKGAWVQYVVQPYPYKEGAAWIEIPSSSMRGWRGREKLSILFEGGTELPLEVEVADPKQKWPWTIVTLDVSHGASTFMRTPDGKTVLIDVAKPEFARDVVVPFLKRNGIKRIDTLILTHFHDDHAGGLPAVKRAVEIGKTIDYRTYRVGQSIDLGGVKTTVLNGYESGNDENPRSLALRMELNGFVFQHGGDTYGQNQEQMLRLFPEEQLRAHVFHANHHLHGSIDVDFYRRVDPVIVLVSAEESVYARGAYSMHYRENVERYLRSRGARLVETLLTREVGSVRIDVKDKDQWRFGTVRSPEDLIVR